MNLKSVFFSFLCLQQVFNCFAQNDSTPKLVICLIPEPASYVGGRDSLVSFLKRNIRIPAQAVENKITDKVYLRFIITKTGSVTNSTIKKGIPDCLDCDKEALRVVNLMPAWNPAKSDSDFVDSYYTLPIVFNCGNLTEENVKGIPVALEPLPPPDPLKIDEFPVADCGEPSFVGGRESLLSYIQRHLSIHDSCTTTGTDTKFRVKLLIDTAGKVTRVELLNMDFLADDCRERIEQVFYDMPKWNAGITNGESANKWIFVPITLAFKED